MMHRNGDDHRHGRPSSHPNESWWSDFSGRLAYQYFNWRQDTWSDLQLFVIFNTFIIMAGAWLQGQVSMLSSQDTIAAAAAAAAEGDAPPPWWSSLYQVLVVILGQELPEEKASFTQQLFAVGTAILGLASFALVLALVEQVVLEVLEGNVRRGSKVYEEGHYLVLAWGESARDIGQVNRVLLELCAANAASGGAVIVVVAAHREKLELEELFRESVPKSRRYGSQLVFRQGSPLDPKTLEMTAAVDTSAVILLGDYSRPTRDSDDMVLRSAVLLDEMVVASGRRHGPVIVVEMQNRSSCELARYSCSANVVPVPTSTINALRFARMLWHPAVASVSHGLFDHTSQAHARIFPHVPMRLFGTPFARLHAYFPEAIITGVFDTATGTCQLNPPTEHRLMPGEALVMLRPGLVGDNFTILEEPLPSDLGAGWNPATYAWTSVDDDYTPSIEDRTPKPADKLRARYLAPPIRGRGQLKQSPLTTLPVQYGTVRAGRATRVLICGWAGSAFMSELLGELDSGNQALPPGSNITLVCPQDLSEIGEKDCEMSVTLEFA